MKGKYDLEDMVCLASLQKCFAAATTELCLKCCARNSSFVTIPQSRYGERYLSTTCYRPTSKESQSLEDSPMAEDFYINLLQDSKAKFFLLCLVS